jgi:hypothetical protein
MPFGGEVQLVPWPQGERQRRAIARAGQLCLLLVEPNDLPPADLGPGEDWVRTTADPIEVHVRGERLVRSHAGGDRPPGVDDQGILRHGSRWAALGPGDTSIVATLCESFGLLVARDVLCRCVSPVLSNPALSVRLFRLRPTLASVGLSVTTVRGRGYVLGVASDEAQPAHGVPT